MSAPMQRTSTRAELCVIGAGCAGLAAAKELKLAGRCPSSSSGASSTPYGFVGVGKLGCSLVAIICSSRTHPTTRVSPLRTNAW